MALVQSPRYNRFLVHFQEYNFPCDKEITGHLSVYLKRGEYNIILVHWTKLAGLPWYVTAVRNTRIVGPQVARLVNWLDAQGAISLASLHVIGFSLGAEIAGFMGKALAPRKVWKFRLSRVIRNFTFTKDVQSEFRLEGSQDWTQPILFT